MVLSGRPTRFLSLDEIVEELWSRDIERAFEVGDLAKLYPIITGGPSCSRLCISPARPTVYAREVATRLLKVAYIGATRQQHDRRCKVYHVRPQTLKRLGLD